MCAAVAAFDPTPARTARALVAADAAYLVSDEPRTLSEAGLNEAYRELQAAGRDWQVAGWGPRRWTADRRLLEAETGWFAAVVERLRSAPVCVAREAAAHRGIIERGVPLLPPAVRGHAWRSVVIEPPRPATAPPPPPTCPGCFPECHPMRTRRSQFRSSRHRWGGMCWVNSKRPSSPRGRTRGCASGTPYSWVRAARRQWRWPGGCREMRPTRAWASPPNGRSPPTGPQARSADSRRWRRWNGLRENSNPTFPVIRRRPGRWRPWECCAPTCWRPDRTRRTRGGGPGAARAEGKVGGGSSAGPASRCAQAPARPRARSRRIAPGPSVTGARPPGRGCVPRGRRSSVRPTPRARPSRGRAAPRRGPGGCRRRP